LFVFFFMVCVKIPPTYSQVTKAGIDYDRQNRKDQ
jgi:hypothetical protein